MILKKQSEMKLLLCSNVFDDVTNFGKYLGEQNISFPSNIKNSLIIDGMQNNMAKKVFWQV